MPPGLEVRRRDLANAWLARRAHDGDAAARAELILRLGPIAHAMAGRVHRGSSLRSDAHAGEDLQQAAMVALIRAIDRFDPARGVKVATFAMVTIDGTLKHYLRDETWPVRRAPAVAVGLDKVREPGGDDLGITDFDWAPRLESMLRALPAKERLVLHLRFRCDLSQAAVARRMGISQMHVSRLLRRSMDRLHVLDVTP